MSADEANEGSDGEMEDEKSMGVRTESSPGSPIQANFNASIFLSNEFFNVLDLSLIFTIVCLLARD